MTYSRRKYSRAREVAFPSLKGGRVNVWRACEMTFSSAALTTVGEEGSAEPQLH